MKTGTESYIHWKQKHYYQDVIKSQYICHTQARKNTQNNSILPFLQNFPLLQIPLPLPFNFSIPLPFLGIFGQANPPFKQKGASNYEKSNTFKSGKALYDGRELVLNASKSGIFPLKLTQGRGIKILTPKQMFQRLPIALAQVKLE